MVKERLIEWQMDGKIPRNILPTNGDKTEEPIRTRGWTHWHHLFNPRQLLWLGLLQEVSAKYNYSKATYVSLILNAARCSNFNSKLCIWDGSPYKSGGWGAFVQTFSNQALNPLYNYGSRSGRAMYETWHNELDYYVVSKNGLVFTSDARSIDRIQDFWITDPPYADAINYHELGDFFIAWYEKHLGELFPEWYTDSKSPLAVKGSGIDFNASMVDCFSNFTYLMPSNGAQVVMFTHQDSAVWADLALILWASGLQVTAAWTIQTETDAAGIKKGNYVQGTACMVLRKQSSSEKGYLADIQADVEFEVRDELKKMMELDDKEDPNFSDTDYQLAAYVAALRVITSYKIIQDIDVRYELMRNRQPGETSEIQKIIDSAVKVSCEYLVPAGFDQALWRQLSGDERFYIKALEIQSHGEYRTGVFQELSRGFGLRDYKPFLKSGKANETRLMTAIEFGTKQLGDDGFGKSLVRQVLFAIRETHQHESAKDGRQWLYTELPDYWSNRQRIIKLLAHIQRFCSHIDHWSNDIKATEILTGYLQNDMTGS